MSLIHASAVRPYSGHTAEASLYHSREEGSLLASAWSCHQEETRSPTSPPAQPGGVRSSSFPGPRSPRSPSTVVLAAAWLKRNPPPQTSPTSHFQNQDEYDLHPCHQSSSPPPSRGRDQCGLQGAHQLPNPLPRAGRCQLLLPRGGQHLHVLDCQTRFYQANLHIGSN